MPIDKPGLKAVGSLSSISIWRITEMRTAEFTSFLRKALWLSEESTKVWR